MKHIFTFLSIFLLALSINVFAQTQENGSQLLVENNESVEQIDSENIDPFSLLTEDEKSQLSICSPELNPDSVRVDLSAEISEVVAGTSIALNGEISNMTNLKISDATMYVKILRTGAEGDAIDIVDHFVVQENISISPKSSIPISFDWDAPSTVESGNYKVVSYVYINNKFDVGGISNTQALLAGSYDFSILGEEGRVALDAASLSLNGENYAFNFAPIKVDESGDVLISILAYNTTLEDQNAQITWNVYKNDSKDSKNLIKTINSDATISTGSTYQFELNLNEKEFPVYHIVGELKNRDTKSIVEVRYSILGTGAVQILSSTINKYPLVKREPATVSLCLHNIDGAPVVKDTSISIELKNSKGKVIETQTYNGPITSQSVSVTKTFSSFSNMNSFSIHTKVWNGGKLSDEYVDNYDCKILDPENCKQNFFNELWYVLIGVVLIVGLLILKNKIKTNKNIILPVLVLVLSVSFFTNPSSVFAKSVTSSKTISSMSTGGYPSYNMSNVTVTGTYNAEVRNVATGAKLSDNASVPVGTKLRFSFESESISWQASGPRWLGGYGQFKNGAPEACTGAYTDRSDLGGLTSNAYGILVNSSTVIYSYISASLSPLSKDINYTGNLSCGSVSGNKMECTVTDVGPISVTFSYSDTSGKMYRSTNNVFTQSGYYVTNPRSETCSGPYAFNPGISLDSKTISYRLNGVPITPPNKPPNPPVISGATTGNPTIQNTFGFVGTDPDNNKVRYGVDWNNDDTVDQWLPGTGTVNSGVSKNGTKAWPNIGVKNFKALTEDEHGLKSGWSRYSVTISSPPVNGMCSTTTNFTCTAGTRVEQTDTASQYLWQCNGSNGGTNASCSLPIPVRTDGVCSTTANQCTAGNPINRTTSPTQYQWQCSATNGGTVPSCTAPRTTTTGPFSVSCSAGSVSPGQQATFTANTQNASGAVSYQWKEANGTNIIGATGSTFTRTYSAMGSYLLNIFATSSGTGANNFCNVTVACTNQYTEGEIETACSNNIERVWTCSGSGWVTTSRVCDSGDEPIGTFGFDPGIVSTASGRCKLELEAENVSTCRLIKSGATYTTTPSLNSFLIGNSISINGSITIPIGRYTLECTGIGENPVTKTFGVKSCILNPDIMEY